MIASARTLQELEQVAMILGYKKGWAYRVHESRKHKPQFHKGKKIQSSKSKLTMAQKEAVSKIIALNAQSFDLLCAYNQASNFINNGKNKYIIFSEHIFTGRNIHPKWLICCNEG